MSGLAIMFFAAFAAATVFGIWMGCKGMFSDSPPFMQGEGNVGRYDERMNRVA